MAKLAKYVVLEVSALGTKLNESTVEVKACDEIEAAKLATGCKVSMMSKKYGRAKNVWTVRTRVHDCGANQFGVFVVKRRNVL